MIIEWDPDKNSFNLDKHGVSFEEAQGVFEDPFHLSILDERFSYFEERWITMGKAHGGALLVIAHLYVVEQEDEKVRIISARKATRKERKDYETIE